MAKTKMGVVGCGGRMGRMLVAEIAATEGCTVAGGSEAPGSGYVNQDIGELAGIGRIGIPIGEAVDKLIRDSDVVLEFTSPAATAEHAALAAGLGKAMVIGTTGLSSEQGDVVRLAARDIPIVWAPNMSLGVNVLLSVVEEAARRLGPDWDIEIMEMHHRGKVDAPSGTALALGRAAAAGREVVLEQVEQRARDGITGPRRAGDIGFAALARRRCGRRPSCDFCRDRRASRIQPPHDQPGGIRQRCGARRALGSGPPARALWVKGGAGAVIAPSAGRAGSDRSIRPGLNELRHVPERLANRRREFAPG